MVINGNASPYDVQLTITNWEQPMYNHPDKDRIIDDLIDDVPWKQIVFKYKVSTATLVRYLRKYVTVRKERKFDPGEDQLTFWGGRYR